MNIIISTKANVEKMTGQELELAGAQIPALLEHCRKVCAETASVATSFRMNVEAEGWAEKARLIQVAIDAETPTRRLIA